LITLILITFKVNLIPWRYSKILLDTFDEIKLKFDAYKIDSVKYFLLIILKKERNYFLYIRDKILLFGLFGSTYFSGTIDL